ncbi:MAG: tetratricopeptide repeat protein [Kiritimatiellia bacterium]
MTTHSDKAPQPDDPLRTAANRRIFVFVAVFTLLLVGAIALVMREEKRRSLLIRPTPTLPLPAPEAVPAPPVPAPSTAPAPPPPSSGALRESEQMEEALAAYRSAEEMLLAQRFDQAEERALAALRAFPKMASAQRLLGLVYLQQGRIDLAINQLEASLRNEPFHPQALTDLSVAYLQNRNPGVALELIETCRRLHPDYKPAVLQHGLILLSQPDFERAIEVLREAIEAFPRLPGPRNNLAVALARSGDRAGAREQLASLLDIAPDNFSALFNMGALYAQETNAPAAIPWLQRAMERMNPAQFQTYLNDPDLAPIRATPEFKQFLQNLDPVFPGPKPGP